MTTLRMPTYVIEKRPSRYSLAVLYRLTVGELSVDLDSLERLARRVFEHFDQSATEDQVDHLVELLERDLRLNHPNPRCTYSELDLEGYLTVVGSGRGGPWVGPRLP